MIEFKALDQESNQWMVCLSEWGASQFIIKKMLTVYQLFGLSNLNNIVVKNDLFEIQKSSKYQ